MYSDILRDNLKTINKNKKTLKITFVCGHLIVIG